ncbi:MAG: sporulation protein YqfD [Ruminococcus sp.]|nr:sporulation protein YqfD [Ruminococcus sp.]
MKHLNLSHFPFLKRKYRISGENTSKLLAYLTKTQLGVNELKQENDCIELTVPFYNSRQLEKICDSLGLNAKIINEGDLLKLTKRILGRPGLIIGFLIFGLIILYLKDVVLRIDIINEDKQIQERIIHVLDEEGVKAGTYIPSIELVKVERALKQRVEGISWAGITRKGNSLIIDVIETIPKAKGSYSRFPTNLVAKENATVDKVLLLDGQLKVIKGSGVRKGDIIISGAIETEEPQSKEDKEAKQTKVRYTRAMGTVEGTFERTVVFEQKYDDVIKVKTGQQVKQRYFSLFSADIPLFFKQKTGDYYSEIESAYPEIAGLTLPFGLKTLVLDEYDRRPVHYSDKEALELCMKQAERYEKNYLEEYEIKEKNIEKSSDKSSSKLTVKYILYGNICEEAAFFIKK